MPALRNVEDAGTEEGRHCSVVVEESVVCRCSGAPRPVTRREE